MDQRNKLPQNLLRNGYNMMDLERNKILYPRQFYNPQQQSNNPRYNQVNYQPENEEEIEDQSDTESEIEDLYQETPHLIVISSADRNWTGNNPNSTQYNFQVKFSPSSDSIANKPLYENNPTIPATNSQAMNGLRGDENTSGWTYNDTTYNSYRPDLPLGKIVAYEKIVEQGQKGASLRNIYKNVVSIELLGMNLPAIKRRVEYSSSLRESTISDPYYLLEIDEIDETMDGTNRNLNNAFAVLSPIVPMYDSLIPKHVEYKVIGRWLKKFSPAPLNTLNHLSLSLKKQTGEILKNLNDTLDIKYIYQYQSDSNDPRTEVLIIETQKYFSEYEYQTTDTIIFKNYQHYNTSTDQSQKFNDFINRSEGHRILEISSNDSDLYLKNRIHIARPASYDLDNGLLSEEGWFTTFKEFELDTEITINNRSTYDNGRLLNLDLQNLYFFKIITKEQNMSRMILSSERI